MDLEDVFGLISSDRKFGLQQEDKNEKASVMRDMIMGGGMMMWGMGSVGWFVLVLVVLAIAALIKYVFFN